MMQTVTSKLRAAKTRIVDAAKRRPQSVKRIARDAQTYWAGSADDQGRRDLSHWVGEGRWAETDLWRQIGQTHFEMFCTLCDLASIAPPTGRMMEWGPGGGANAVRFAEAFEAFIGVDISQANLDECARQLHEAGYDGFDPILIDAATPERIAERVTEPIDFFLCTAVYQHFPGPEYGRRVTRCVSDLLAPGGVALIQTRYPNDDPTTASKSGNYDDNVLQFTSYRVEEFWTVARDCGLEPMMVKLVECDRYAYYFLRKADRCPDE